MQRTVISATVKWLEKYLIKHQRCRPCRKPWKRRIDYRSSLEKRCRMSSILSPVQNRGTKPGTCFRPRSDHGGISQRWMSIYGKDIADTSRTIRAGQRNAVDTGALVGA